MAPAIMLRKELHSVGRYKWNTGAAMADIAPAAMKIHRMVLEALGRFVPFHIGRATVKRLRSAMPQLWRRK